MSEKNIDLPGIEWLQELRESLVALDMLDRFNSSAGGYVGDENEGSHLPFLYGCCGTCQHWELNPSHDLMTRSSMLINEEWGEHGLCKKNPPQKGHQNAGSWTDVPSEEWCGCWEHFKKGTRWNER
jgi:hypothetical protein